MSIAINCKISLSKKLRAFIDSGGALSLIVPRVVDGKGVGHLTLSSENTQDETFQKILDVGETSIIITPTEVAPEMPGNIGQSTANLFTSTPSKGHSEPVVSKIAAVNAPEAREMGTAVAPASVPTAFPELKEPECQAYISDMTGLIEAVNSAKSKKSSIDISQAANDRERAVLLEQRDRDEGIDIPAYIVNVRAAKIIINDLDISLSLNTPFDLSNISARRIASSRDLRELIKGGFVKFITPAEIGNYVDQAVYNSGVGVGQLEVFSSPEEAEANMARTATNIPINPEDVLDITESTAGGLTEEESMILDLTSGMSATPTSPPAGTRISSHGGASYPSQRHPTNPNIRTVNRVD